MRAWFCEKLQKFAALEATLPQPASPQARKRVSVQALSPANTLARLLVKSIARIRVRGLPTKPARLLASKPTIVVAA